MLTAGELGGDLSVDDLLERQAALAELNRCRRAAGRRSGRMVLLRGEAGVGKTALLAQFVAGLGQKARVMRGWCDPLAAPRPLGPLIDMLADLSGQHAARLRASIDAGDTEAIYAGLVGLFGDAGPWFCVIEDVHWADGATLDLLRYLARRIDALPLLLLVSYRDDELGDQHPLVVLLGDVATFPAVTRVGLDPLSEAAVGMLAAGSGINAERLHELTGGNPFYITEILAAGPDQLDHDVWPRSVSAAVWGRLARLSAPGRDTAYATAVCGPRADLALVQSVCPSAGAGLAECLHAGVLVADGDVIGFRHELARRATMEQITHNQRRILHKQALTALAEPPIDPDTLAALAFHADHANDPDEAVRYGIAAAGHAAALGAHRQAAELYALALLHAHGIPAEQQVIWLEQHALTSGLCGLGDPAVSSLRKAVELRHQLGDRLGEAEDLRWLSFMLWPLGRVSEATDAAWASLRLLQDAGPCPQLAWALLNLAEQSVFGFDPAAADFAAQAITVGVQVGEDTVVVRARAMIALRRVVHTDTGWEELEEAWRQAMSADAHGDKAGLLGAIICAFAAGHYHLDRADRYIADFVAFSRDRDIHTFGVFSASADALVGLHRGQWTRARERAEDVLTRPGLPAVHGILARLILALVHARRGDQPVAALFDAITACAEPGQLRLFPVWGARAEAAWLAGDDETARREAQTGLAVIGADADPWQVWQLHRWAQLAGATPESITVENPVTPFELEVGGDWQAAAQAWMHRGCPYEAAIAQLGGDIDAVQAAAATLRKLGARAAARRAQQRLATLRGRTPCSRRADTLSDPNGLTRRERDVLELIAGGCSDAEIAAALHISPKTAGSHVSSILTKLGVDNRIQAAARSLQRQTAPPA